jgi:hypothetical protein
MSDTTHITSEVLLLAQNGLIPLELPFEATDEFFEVILICRFAAVALEQLLVGDAARIRIKLRILDACCLLELGIGLWLGGDQLCAGTLRGKVAGNSARLVQLEAVLILLIRGNIRYHEYMKGLGETYDNVWHLAERLVCLVRRLLVVARHEVDGDDLIRDVTLLGNKCHTASASGLRDTVKLDSHGELSIRLL